ncbi:Glycosyl transferase family 8 [Musa troglodytarum]|uniref:Glycosyl transferase family 8 n=1 Tax=Musa troglodytarum TaxID=320322 RepID=A0A9E7GLM8_9LILI|nr:Glycosyl transferase family 8 [Musa troglodytarum]
MTMRGLNNATPNLAEGRDETSKRKMRCRDCREGDECRIMFSDWSSGCKFHSLKLALFMITCCAALTLLRCPAAHNEQLLQSSSRSRFADVGWIWQKKLSDPRYLSSLDVDRRQVSDVLRSVDGREGSLRIGLLNFDVTEIGEWRRTMPNAELSVVVNNIFSLQPIQSVIFFSVSYNKRTLTEFPLPSTKPAIIVFII